MNTVEQKGKNSALSSFSVRSGSAFSLRHTDALPCNWLRQLKDSAKAAQNNRERHCHEEQLQCLGQVVLGRTQSSCTK